jgi:hypothetical protein
MRDAKQIFQFFALKLQAEAKYFGMVKGQRTIAEEISEQR